MHKHQSSWIKDLVLSDMSLPLMQRDSTHIKEITKFYNPSRTSTFPTLDQQHHSQRPHRRMSNKISGQALDKQDWLPMSYIATDMMDRGQQKEVRYLHSSR